MARLALPLLLAALVATPAVAQDDAALAADQAFIGAFVDVCVPQRTSYEGTRQTAVDEGWVEVQANDDPELNDTMQRSLAGALSAEFKIDYLFKAFKKDIEGQPLYLVVSRIAAETAEGVPPSAEVVCVLYNFAAEAPVDPELIGTAFNTAIIAQQVDMHIGAWMWNAPAELPGTGEIYMTFIPEMSQYRPEAGFSGLTLKFSTAEPAPAATQ